MIITIIGIVGIAIASTYCVVSLEHIINKKLILLISGCLESVWLWLRVVYLLNKRSNMNMLFSINDIKLVLERKPNWSVREIIEELQSNNTRTIAIKWWNSLSIEVKESISFAYLPRRTYYTLTGREIEYIYTQSKKD